MNTIYLVYIDFPHEPGVIIGVTLSLERAREIAKDHSAGDMGKTTIHAMEDSKDYDYGDVPKVSMLEGEEATE